MGKTLLDRLLDSVIIIDHLNGIEQATQFIMGLDPRKTAISVITRAEVLAGVDEPGEMLVKAFLDQYCLLGIDKEATDLAATLRRNHAWKLPDAFQAAISINNNIKLATSDTKDFDPAKYDFVEVPYLL